MQVRSLLAGVSWRGTENAGFPLPRRPDPARLGADDADLSPGMEKEKVVLLSPQPRDEFQKPKRRVGWLLGACLIFGAIILAALLQWKLGPYSHQMPQSCDVGGIHDMIHDTGSLSAIETSSVAVDNPYGSFPRANDAFRLLPCTNKTVPPPVNDTNAVQTWTALFNPDPKNWNWGPTRPASNTTGGSNTTSGDPYAGRGIFLCGYLDVPLDYTNKSDGRIVRLAITKYQVSGLARADAPPYSNSTAGRKSERTIIIEPGGPGGSGTSYAWSSSVSITRRFSDEKFDVLGWDPRGVNISRPTVECITHDATRDRWYLYTSQHRAASPSPKVQFQIADAMNEATMQACWEKHGDLGRFLTTAFVARDLDEIRKALGEDDITGYLVSYGTGIGQTYAGMFPNTVGRMILDGTEYVRDHRTRGGFGWTALDNSTDAWRDGFLGECLKAGPDYCALAKPRDGKPVTLTELMARMDKLIKSLIDRPIPVTLKSSGPTLVTHSYIVDAIYSAMYSPRRWPTFAQMLYDLESGNATVAASRFELSAWWYSPQDPCPELGAPGSDSELGLLVICSDQYDAPEPDDVDWWLSLWGNMTTTSWIAGNSRWYTVLPCRHFNKFWPKPAEVFRGNLSLTLKTPILLVAETYDPATPLRNGRRLHAEMGNNARMIVHHGYGHASGDVSNCTDAIAKAYILNGTIPEKLETDCYANEKPYLYGVTRNATATSTTSTTGPPTATQTPVSVSAAATSEIAPEATAGVPLYGAMGWRKYLGDGLDVVEIGG